MKIEALQVLVSEDIAQVNELITQRLQSPIKLINEIAQHVIQSGGKRLRCLLVLLASRACKYTGTEHIMLATMIEFFHTATLLHDDVIDEATLRRGSQTAHTIWGNKASILVGDYLFTKYLELMVEVGDIQIIQLLVGIAPQMSSGEIQQFSNTHNFALTIEEYFDVIRSKTALLFAASATIGALIAQTCQKTQQALYTYGLHLGNAFQLIDDAIDYSSNLPVTGKNIGSDLACGKITLPLIHVLQHGNVSQKNLVTQSLQSGTLHDLPKILQALVDTKAIEETRRVAKQEINAAIAALSILPETVYKEGLVNLALFVAERDH